MPLFGQRMEHGELHRFQFAFYADALAGLERVLLKYADSVVQRIIVDQSVNLDVAMNRFIQPNCAEQRPADEFDGVPQTHRKRAEAVEVDDRGEVYRPSSGSWPKSRAS